MTANSFWKVTNKETTFWLGNRPGPLSNPQRFDGELSVLVELFFFALTFGNNTTMDFFFLY